jgi:hypothetical protein
MPGYGERSAKPATVRGFTNTIFDWDCSQGCSSWMRPVRRISHLGCASGVAPDASGRSGSRRTLQSIHLIYHTGEGKATVISETRSGRWVRPINVINNKFDRRPYQCLGSNASPLFRCIGPNRSSSFSRGNRSGLLIAPPCDSDADSYWPCSQSQNYERKERNYG